MENILGNSDTIDFSRMTLFHEICGALNKSYCIMRVNNKKLNNQSSDSCRNPTVSFKYIVKLC